MMVALDGNAIAGLLYDVFGAEMTTAAGICAHCRTRGVLAECEVYLGGPGVVVRCHSCSGLQIVVVEIRGVRCVDLNGLEILDTEGARDG
jgi:class 3 adenylate cyclase